MKLDEAIKHCKEVAKNLYAEGDDECTNCANEHEQLAEWLEELREWRELKVVGAFDGYVVYIGAREFKKSSYDSRCDNCGAEMKGGAE